MRMVVGSALAVGFFSVLLSGCDGGESTSSGGGGSNNTSTSQGGAGGSGGENTSSTTTGGAGGAGGGAIGQPFSSKGESSYETQTTLASDSMGGVVVAWIAFFGDNTSGIGYAISRDGGDHFTAPKIIKSPDGRLASNPVLAADKKGQFSLAWLGFRPQNGPDEHVYVSRLDNKKEEFGAPAIASDDGSQTTLDFDKPSLKVDATDALLLTWADFSLTGAGGPAKTIFARSADAKTFDRVTVASDITFGNLASLCLDTTLGAAAPLYLVHLGANGAVSLRTSVNQGQSWELRPTPATQTVFQDITCIAKGSSLSIVYGSGAALFNPTLDSPADSVMIMSSPNGGVAFDSPVIVASGGGTKQFLFPQLVRAPSGDLAVVYYEGVVGEAANFMLSTSADGKAWSAAPIATAGTFTIDRTIASWLGAYVGFAIPSDQALVSFAENTENKTHIRFAQAALP